MEARIYNTESNEVAVILRSENQDAIVAKYEEMVCPLTRKNYPEIMKEWHLNEDEFALSFAEFGLIDVIETFEINC